MLDKLLLLSGNDIPFAEAQLTVHNPTLKEIAYIGEEAFFTGYQMLCISKELLPDEDKVNLEVLSNFDILIAILKERNAVMQKNRNCVLMILALLFPTCAITFDKDSIVFTENDNNTKHILNKNNFDQFQILIKQMFSFGQDEEGVQSEFNPEGELSKRIADKLKKRHQKLAEQKNLNEQLDILGRYSSVISVGFNLPITAMMNYTVYQLFDQIKRYELKHSYDINIQSRLAGAKDIKDPEDWMKSIH